jgi:uncharacterized protein (DUF1499 family)
MIHPIQRFDMVIKALAAIIFCAVLAGCHGTPPANIGVKDGKLAACPSSPNCVSSQSPTTDTEHYIAPLHYSGSRDEARAALISVIESMKRTRIVSVTDDYVYAEFTSRIFRFVDDVEFSFDDSTKTIHVRSASRLGHSDLGVNRKRIETIRQLFDRRMQGT